MDHSPLPDTSFWQQAYAVLRAPFEPRDPDHFAGPGFPQQEPDLVAEQRGGGA